ncbi:MAG TPA: FAD-binding domain [Gemmatimonadales bacterium]
MNDDRSVLISGAGVAGPALAWWLLRHGWSPTMVERAPRLRTQGYVIDFWGAGYDLAEKMGLLPQIESAGYRIRELRFVDALGRRVGGFDAEVFRRATLGRYISLSRTDLSAILFRAVEGRAETIFGDHIVGLAAGPDSVSASFARGPERQFRLVIGADGLHSAVRALAFGPESRYEVPLGYTVAAFECAGYQPREADTYVAFSAAGRQVARFTMRDDRTMFLFVIADDAGPAAGQGATAHIEYLRRHFGDMGWEVPAILAALERTGDVYFDRVSQIRMDHWSSGRVGLVGDAAYAPSLLAGQGSALAIIGAYVLAGELSRGGQVPDALARYEVLLRPFMESKQRGANQFAKSFAPRTALGVRLRNLVSRAFNVPAVARLALGRSLLDKIPLPEYP